VREAAGIERQEGVLPRAQGARSALGRVASDAAAPCGHRLTRRTACLFQLSFAADACEQKGLFGGRIRSWTGVARFEDPRLLKGGGSYVDDIVLPRMAFGYVLRSPHAHARSAQSTARRRRKPRRPSHIDGRGLEAFRVGRSAGPGGQRLREGGAMYRRPIRLWRGIASAGSATTSPSSSPKTYLQAADGLRADRAWTTSL